MQRSRAALVTIFGVLTACYGPVDDDSMGDETDAPDGDTTDAYDDDDGDGPAGDPSEDPDGDSDGDGSMDDPADDCGASVPAFLACAQSINATPEELARAGEREPLTEPIAGDEFPTEDDVVMVCTSTDYSLLEAPQTYVALDPHADTLYPGSLVQSQPIRDGRLEGVHVARGPGAVTLTLLSGADASFSRSITPTLAEATEAMNEILVEHAAEEVPAHMAHDFVRVHSDEQMGVEFHAAANGTSWSAGVDLDFAKGEGHNRVMVRFTQKYFTMAYEPEDGHLAADVTVADLQQYGIEATNPLAYVSSVTYGRDFFVLFESTESFEDLDTAVRAAYDSASIGASADLQLIHRKVLENATVTGFARGGDAAMAAQALSGDVEDVLAFIQYGANTGDYFSAVPLSYAVRYVHGNELLQLPLTSEFTVDECYPVDGSIPLQATLGYVGMEFTDATGCEVGDQLGEFWFDVWVEHDGEALSLVEMACETHAQEPTIRIGEHGAWDGRPGGELVLPFFYDDGLDLVLGAAVQEKDGVSCALNTTDVGSATRALSFTEGEWSGDLEMFEVPGSQELVDTFTVSGGQNGCYWNAHFTFEVD